MNRPLLVKNVVKTPSWGKFMVHSDMYGGSGIWILEVTSTVTMTEVGLSRCTEQ